MSSWRPLLEGELAERGWLTVRDIAQALTTQSSQASLSGGKAGVALFYDYFAQVAGRDSATYAELAQKSLDDAIELMGAMFMEPGLHSGFTGVAWVAEHLSRRTANGNGEDEDHEIDAALLTLLDQTPWTGHFDLISGLVGFGVYALQCADRPSAVRCLEAIVDHLDQTAERNGNGVTWYTAPELIPAIRQSVPRGYYDLGVAHGVPGVIALLAECCMAGIRGEVARVLLEGAVQWLLSQRLPTGQEGPSLYPWHVAPAGRSGPARLAWCYGDPGIAVSLLLAARAAGRVDWENEALAIARRAAQASPQDSGVRDAGLCHGAFGLAHLYNRIYQACADEAFADASRGWYRLGLDMRNPATGTTGFVAWHVRDDGSMGWVDDCGFLTGAAGVGMALLAAMTEVEPQWDHCLLSAITPQTA